MCLLFTFQRTGCIIAHNQFLNFSLLVQFANWSGVFLFPLVAPQLGMCHYTNSEYALKSESRVAMLRWFLFLVAIVLLVLGGFLVAMILTSPVEVKKEEDDE